MAAMQSDHASQMMYVDYIRSLAEMPNITIDQVESLMGGFGELRRHAEMAVLPAVAEGRLGFNDVKMVFDMTVGAHTSAVKDTEVKASSKTEVGVSGGFPLGPKITAKQTLSADVRHQNKQTRDTDMSASVHIEAGLGRQAPPEGVSRMIDDATEFSRNCNEINKMITGAKIAEIKGKIESGDFDPDAKVEPPASDGAPAPAAPAAQ
ncbi:MAG: DUF2589 domain-containing protein [Rhodospirillales bacterium]|nr:DUF2589 domain-containing protein [Rhodospirillales bacterium]